MSTPMSTFTNLLARAPFSTWLTRIAVHEALARLRLRGRNQQLEDTGNEGDFPMKIVDTSPDPEQSASRAELASFSNRHCLTSTTISSRSDVERCRGFEHLGDRRRP